MQDVPRQGSSAEVPYLSQTLEPAGEGLKVRYYRAEPAVAAVIYVGGAGGGWDTPGRDLYPRLAAELLAVGIAGLRLRFRRSTDLGSCVHDVTRGIDFLLNEGIYILGLVGHSLGGAAVIQAATAQPAVRTVVALSSQSFGAEHVGRLSPGCSVLFIHGLDDPVLRPSRSLFLFRQAGEPKQIELLPGTGHVLEERAEEVHRLVRDWLVRELSGSGVEAGATPSPAPSI